MNKLRLQSNFDWLDALYIESPENVLIEIIDMKIKWGPILQNKKTCKWVLKALIKNADNETRIQAIAIYIHLYGEIETPKIHSKAS